MFVSLAALSIIGRAPSAVPADLTVVCVDVPGCEQPAILSTAQGGTIIYFSMATSFSAAALGAEGLAADVRMLVGNGYVPGHADLALDLLRATPAVRALFEGRDVGLGGARAVVQLKATSSTSSMVSAKWIVISWRTSCSQISYLPSGVRNRLERRPGRSNVVGPELPGGSMKPF